MTTLEQDYVKPHSLENVMESDVPDTYLIPDKLLKRANILDICHRASTRSCCFTKAYSHYIEGTGSVFTEASPEAVKKIYEKANYYETGSDEFINSVKSLNLRFFTPKEVLRLMTFPEYFSFPKNTSRKQCYRLLGNSVNIKVISELLKILYS